MSDSFLIRKLAAQFLRDASDRYANDTCNDFEMRNTPEVIELLNEMEVWNVGGIGTSDKVWVYEPDKETVIVPNWYLMAFLAHKLYAPQR